ncbi:MAG: ABC transporter permease [Cyclobacteriaceae bacterium]
MLKNYINIAFRNLIKHKFYSLINILGLSIGLTCFLMITLFVTDELSFDEFHADADRIHRMDFTGNINGSEFITALASVPAAETMVREFPEVEDATRLRTRGNYLVKKKDGEDSYNEDASTFADKNFFDFFDFEVLSGNKSTCLERPNTIAISSSLATKIFGKEDPVGSTLVLDNDEDYEITAVFEDMPANSHFRFNMLMAMEGLEEAKQTFWMSFNFNTYLKLQEGFDPKELEAKFPALIEKYIGPEIEQYMGASLEEFAAAGNVAGFFLFPLTDIHLKSSKLGDIGPGGSMQYVYIFTAIALFILILACINFMNLSTARSAGRAKEVGVRKVMGAYRTQLVNQFLSEAFLITLISIVIAYSLSFLILPFFNDLAEKSINSSNLFTLSFIGIMVAILFVVGFLAGSYPAFYLSKFRPIETLKGKLNLGLKGSGLRGFLVVLQFSVSIIMIIGTAIVFDQLSYIQNKKLGYSKDQILMIHDPWLMDDKAESFKNEAVQHSSIMSGTMSSFLPVETSSNNNLWFPGATPTKEESYVFSEFRVDHDYMETLEIEMAEGRSFSKDFPSDSSAVVLNEAALRQLGWEKGVGMNLSSYGGSQENPVAEVHKVIGVVKDFHFQSLKNNIAPLIFELGRSRGFVSFKVSSEDIPATIGFLENKWDEFAPGQPFAYSFLDDRFNEMYKAEQKLGKIFGVFAFLAIFIACLGLYGLAAFTAEQKRKEIGVRKVLGASITSIVTLLSKEFLKLVAISIVIASVISYFAMSGWLEEFENRTEINFMVFVMAGLAALVIAWVTMSFQSWSAARANPAESLKDE